MSSIVTVRHGWYTDSTSTAEDRTESELLEVFENLGRNDFENDTERFSGIFVGSETLPVDQDFEVTGSFTNVFDLVHGVPDEIGELSDFLDLGWSPNRSLCVRLDAEAGAQSRCGSPIGRERSGKVQPNVDIFVHGPCVRATTTYFPTVGL